MTRPDDQFHYLSAELCAEKIPIREIVDAVGSPAYIYSAEAFLGPLRVLKQGLAPVDHLICYAVKANSNLAILNLLAEQGAGADLVSSGELFRALRAGVPPDRIVFSGVGKTRAEMQEALEKGIYSFNVESTAELEALSEVAMQLGQRARVALRFNPDVDAKTHPYISTGLKKNKFGLNRKEVLAVAGELERYPGVELRGLSIHIGSQLLSLSPLGDAFRKTRELLTRLESLLPRPLEFVDLGGGLGIAYKNERPPRIADYCKLILKHFGPAARLPHPLKILIEPGRTLAGNAGVLVTRVLFRKARGKKDFLVVDAAMNDLIRPALYGSYHAVVPLDQRKTRGKAVKTDLVGPVCESADCFGSDRPLSRQLQPGDLLAVLSSGAYGFSMSSNYNSRCRPPEVLVRNGEFRVIRERESLEDLIRGERIK